MAVLEIRFVTTTEKTVEFPNGKTLSAKTIHEIILLTFDSAIELGIVQENPTGFCVKRKRRSQKASEKSKPKT